MRTEGPHAGPHAGPDECIEALRTVIAKMEFRQEQTREKAAARPALAGCRGGWRNRPDARMVLLDGERITLTEAARRLEMSASALHFRIVRRAGTAEYSEVDLRALHVEVKRTPIDALRARMAAARDRALAEAVAV